MLKTWQLSLSQAALGRTKRKRYVLTFMFKLLGRKAAWKTFAGSNEILRPPNGVQNCITFSFLLLSLCLGPVLGSRFRPKSGASHRKILRLPADVLQAHLRRTSISVIVNTIFFLLHQFGEFAQCNCLSGLIDDLARAIWRWTEKS